MKKYILILVFTASPAVAPAMDRRVRRFDDDAKRQNVTKKIRWATQEEVKKELFEKIRARRAILNNYCMLHNDAACVHSVVNLVNHCAHTQQENVQGFQLIQQVFDSDVYHDLAFLLVQNSVVSPARRVYNPEKFLERSIALGAFENSKLLLSLGADPHVFLLYRQLVGVPTSQVYMYAPTVFAREGAPQILSLLLKYGADPNVSTKQENPLYNCILSLPRNARDIVNILLYHGADPRLVLKHAKGQFKESTPLELAEARWRCNPSSNLARDIYELCLNGRQRARDRMAMYLWRLINGNEKTRSTNQNEFPFELCYYIASINYPATAKTHFLEQLKRSSWKTWESKRKTHF